MVEGDDRALLHRAQLAQHRHELLLETWVLDGHLLDLDHETDLAQRELDDLLQQRDVLALAGVELAQLGRGVVAHESLAVGRALERVVVDDDSRLSDDRWTSHSIRSQPAAMAERNDRIVFSGCWAGLPRWPPSSGRPSSCAAS